MFCLLYGPIEYSDTYKEQMNLEPLINKTFETQQWL